MSVIRSFGEREEGVSYTRRAAAYVVILSERGRVACVSAESGLFLPGGGIEPGEDARTAADREVAEECARSLEVISLLEPACQFFRTAGGVAYELNASFFLGSFGSALDRHPQHELQWLPTSPRPPHFFHECHRWAVERALQESAENRLAFADFRVVEYEARHRDAFRDLNLSWIEEYFEVEELDRQQLLQPEDTILRPGGAILVAEDSEGVVGVCALLLESPGRYEVSKMAVDRDLRGRGIGRRLLSEVISHARGLGARQLSIRSNTVLEPAIHLYRQMGFLEVPLPAEQEYARANIALELVLS